MRWRGRRQSSNVEDRRGQAAPGGGFSARGGGGIGNLLMLLLFRGSAKMRIIVIIGLLLGFVFFRGQLLEILGFTSSTSGGARIEQTGPAPNDEMRAYLSTMVGDNEHVWSQLLPKYGVEYRVARMVIYSQRTRTPGGIADARMGPFYLPNNETIYIDPTFFTELKQKFGAKGDFAEAYVVAHEYGHHIQKILGRLNELHGMRGKVSKTEYNNQSVRVELHADFLAGVFARHAESTFGDFLEQGDIEEAMRCAEAIGDDRIQRDMGPGYVNPDSFTHGSSAQRARWFNKGFQTGDLQVGEQLYKLPYDQL